MEIQDENSKMMPAGRVICYSCKLASKHAHSPNFPGQASPHVLLSLASCWQQQMKKAKGKAVSRRKIRAVCSPPSGLSQFLTPPGGGSPSRDDFREGRDWRQWPLISSLTAERLNVPELENYQATKLLPRRVLCVCVWGGHSLGCLLQVVILLSREGNSHGKILFYFSLISPLVLSLYI